MFDSSIDLRPLIDIALYLIAPSLGVAGTWVAYKIGKLLGVKIDAEKAQTLDFAIQKAIEFGISKAKEAAPDKVLVDLKSPIAAYAAQYALNRVPGTLAHFKITPDSLADMIEARLDETISWKSRQMQTIQ